MKKFILLLLIVLPLIGESQTYLLGPQAFDTDVLVHGSSAATTSWFAPNSNTPLDYVASGGNPGGYAGYSGSWNSWWGNFIRLPQVNCTAFDTVSMVFDMSHSYFSAQPNDWIRFYLWDNGGSGQYRNPVTSVKIDGVEAIVNFGANGYGFRFNVARTWAHVEVKFVLTTVIDKSSILFYLEPNCSYNNSNTYFVQFDNIGITANPLDVSVSEKDAVKLSVYPNPASDFVNLQCQAGGAMQSIELYDLNGRLMQRSFANGLTNYRLSVSDIAEGIYQLRIQQTNGNLQLSKLTIIH